MTTAFHVIDEKLRDAQNRIKMLGQITKLLENRITWDKSYLD